MSIPSSYTLTLLAPLVFLSTLAQGQFLTNLDDLLAEPRSDYSSEQIAFLEDLKDACQTLDATRDPTYNKRLPTGMPPLAGQSPASAQSRLCATVIDQFDPTINRHQVTTMASCEKFRNGSEMQLCCKIFRAGYQDLQTKPLAQHLCKNVPMHFDLINWQIEHKPARRQGHSCTQRAASTLRAWLASMGVGKPCDPQGG